MVSLAGEFVRSVIWEALDRAGTEYSTIWKTNQGWILEGVVCRVEKRLPLLFSYRIFCDKKWRTKRVDLKQSTGGAVKKMVLTVDERLHWWTGDRELNKLRGCVDVDLLVSPVTNTLPIRRLGLRNGESRGIRAAWVKSPQLTVQPLAQEYTCLNATTYRYRSESGFSTRIQVDNLGLVMLYPRFWQRRATRRCGPV